MVSVSSYGAEPSHAILNRFEIDMGEQGKMALIGPDPAVTLNPDVHESSGLRWGSAKVLFPGH